MSLTWIEGYQSIMYSEIYAINRTSYSSCIVTFLSWASCYIIIIIVASFFVFLQPVLEVPAGLIIDASSNSAHSPWYGLGTTNEPLQASVLQLMYR